MKLFEIFNKNKKIVPPIPPIDEITNTLYDKSLNYVACQVTKVIYSADKTKRFVILKSDKGYYKYSYEEICVDDEEEWALCYNLPNAYPAYWQPVDKSSAYSFFGTEDEALLSMKQEMEYLCYFE